MGRPSLYTPEVAALICERLEGGESLRTICSAEDMPDRGTVNRWLSVYDDFATKYARARVFQADLLEEDMADIEDRTLSGELDPAAARVVLGSKQWRAAKLAPKVYGDKQQIEHSGAIDLAGAVLAARKRAGKE